MTDIAVALLMVCGIFDRRHAPPCRVPARPAPKVAAPKTAAAPAPRSSGIFGRSFDTNSCNSCTDTCTVPTNGQPDINTTGKMVVSSPDMNWRSARSIVAVVRLAEDDEVLLGSPRANPSFVTSVSLRHGRLTGEDVRAIAAIHQLESLELDHIDFDGVDLSPWHRLARLKNVSFNHCDLTNAPLGWLRGHSLGVVVLHDCRVDARALRGVAGLKIERLLLRSPDCKGGLLEELRYSNTIGSIQRYSWFSEVLESKSSQVLGRPIDDGVVLHLLKADGDFEAEGARGSDQESAWLDVLCVHQASFTDPSFEGDHQPCREGTSPTGVDSLSLAPELRPLLAEPDTIGTDAPGDLFLGVFASPAICSRLAHEETGRSFTLLPPTEFFPGRMSREECEHMLSDHETCLDSF